MKRLLYSLLALLCLSYMPRHTPAGVRANEEPPGSTPFGALMPKQCQPGKTSAGALAWRWRHGTSVRVHFEPGNFNQREIEAMSRAVENWNTALAETGAGVVFLGNTQTEMLAPDTAAIIVTRGEPKGERVGELRFHSRSNGRVRLALIIRPVVTDLDALTSLMTHEIGHSVGLADCYECRRGTTAMSAFKGKNKGNDVYEPSACDKYVVATGYAGEAAQRTPVALLERKRRALEFTNQ